MSFYADILLIYNQNVYLGLSNCELESLQFSFKHYMEFVIFPV